MQASFFFYKLEWKCPCVTEVEKSLCAQYTQFKTNKAEKKKKKEKNYLQILKFLSEVGVAGKWAGKARTAPLCSRYSRVCSHADL